MAKKVSVVYVIDDDESVRRALERLLRSADLHAETFSSADEFLNSPKQKKNACILIDIQIPGSTSFDLQQKLTAFDMRIPVIVISASDDNKFVNAHGNWELCPSSESPSMINPAGCHLVGYLGDEERSNISK